MPPETEVAATPAIETPTPAKADRTDERKPGAKESIADGMRRLGGEKVFEERGEAPGIGGDEAEPTETTETETPEAKAEKPKGKKEVTPEKASAGEIEELRQLATRHGFTLEDGKVTTAERVKLRDDKRANLTAIKAAEAQAMAAIAAVRQEHEPEIAKAKAFHDAVEAGDLDAVAKVIGRDDWNKLQEEWLERQQNPAAKRIRELELREKAREEAAAQAAEHQRQRAEAESLNAEQARYRQALSTTMAESRDPLVKAMAKMPNFVHAVFNAQKAAYQGRSEALTPEQAVRVSPPNGGASLYDELKALHDSLSPVFGKPVGTEATPPATPKPKPRTPVVPSPTPQKRAAFAGDREWKQSGAQRLQDAMNEERRSRSNGRA